MPCSHSRRRRSMRSTLAGLSVALAVAACAEAPVTGRQQLILLPESQDAQMGLEAFQQIKQESRVSQNAELNRRVQEVGRTLMTDGVWLV